MKDFTKRLTTWRDRTGTNAAAAARLSELLRFQVSRRTLEGWVQGKMPSEPMQFFIWRHIRGGGR